MARVVLTRTTRDVAELDFLLADAVLGELERELADHERRLRQRQSRPVDIGMVESRTPRRLAASQ